VRERGSERVEERNPGGELRGGVRGDDLLRARRGVAEPDALESGERDQLVAVLDLVCGRQARGSVDESAADDPDVLIPGRDAVQAGRELAVERRAYDRVVAGAIAGGACPDVVEVVCVRVHELEHVVVMVRQGRNVEHERPPAQVQMGHAVERVVVRRDDHLVRGGGEVPLIAELVDRGVREVVRDSDAGLRLLLAQELQQGNPVDVGVGTDLLGLGRGDRRRGGG